MIRLLDAYTTKHADHFLYELMRQRSQEDDANVNISHRALPTWEAHKAFMESRTYAHWWVIEHDGLMVGSLSATKQNEIGIVLTKEARGKGIGKWAVAWLLRYIEPLPAIPSVRQRRWLANINPANAASIALFTGLGAVHIQNTYAFEERDHGNEESTSSTKSPTPAGHAAG